MGEWQEFEEGSEKGLFRIVKEPDITKVEGIMYACQKNMRDDEIYTIIYRSEEIDGKAKWTQKISDILEIRVGCLSHVDAIKACRQYI